MNEIAGLPAPARILLPDVGALALTARHAVWLTPDGEIEELTPQQLAGRVDSGVLLCHKASVSRRLGGDRFPAFDLLDLFAFVHPARFCLPTVRGLAAWLGLPEPKGLLAECVAIGDIARRLLGDLAEGRADSHSDTVGLADAMQRGGWSWGPAVMAALMLAGKPFKKQAAIAKLVSSEAAMDNARDATQIHGGYGFMNEYTVARHYRDSKILEIGEGTTEVQLMLIARELGLG